MSPTPKESSVAAPRPALQTLMGRMAMVFVVLVSAGLVLWTYFGRYLPVDRNLKATTQRHSALANEVQNLELKWEPQDAGRTEARYKEALGMLFEGPAQFEAWQEEIKRLTAQAGLEAKVTLGAAQPKAALDKYTLQQAVVELQPVLSAQATNSPYVRLLGFTRALDMAPKRADLVELQARGSLRSVEQARALIHLWSQERTP